MEFWKIKHISLILAVLWFAFWNIPYDVQQITLQPLGYPSTLGIAPNPRDYPPDPRDYPQAWRSATLLSLIHNTYMYYNTIVKYLLANVCRN